MKTTKTLSLLLLCSFLAMFLTGCQKAPDQSSEKKVVKLAYVNWAEGVAVTYLMENLLEDMGYTVEKTMADVAPIYAAVASGDQDIMIETWVPVTHKSYWDKFSNNFEELGTWFEKAKLGLVVPAYVEINSIEELNTIKDGLDGKITGIDAGAGIMGATEKVIENYGLDLQLMSSSGPAMTAALKSAIDKNEPIVVTGWAPHWKFARYDLKFLEDPQGSYGAEENVKFICRKGFKEAMPDVAKLFANLKFNTEQIGSLMDEFAQAEGNEDAAIEKWIQENKELVDSWKVSG